MKKFFKEFSQFIAKGNILDLAVALVLGTAFNAIVKSLVNDVIMPLIGILIKTNVSDLKWTLVDAVTENGVVVSSAVTVNYGSFIQTIVDFLVIAFSIFIILKVLIVVRKRAAIANEKIIAALKLKESEGKEQVENTQVVEEEVKEEPKPSNVEILLTEIKDLLSNKNN